MMVTIPNGHRTDVRSRTQLLNEGLTKDVGQAKNGCWGPLTYRECKHPRLLRNIWWSFFQK